MAFDPAIQIPVDVDDDDRQNSSVRVWKWRGKSSCCCIAGDWYQSGGDPSYLSINGESSLTYLPELLVLAPLQGSLANMGLT